MFASTAYEAYYAYIGIYLHEASIKIITSQEVFIGLLILILGCCFLLGTWRYFSQFMPGMFGKGQTVGISFFFKIIACFLVGMSILRIGTEESVKNPLRKSWHKNPYLTSRMPQLTEKYEVSFVFDLLVRSAEEVENFASSIVDKLFAKTNSELEAPSAFYRAVMFAGAQTIDDPELKDKLDVYSNNCFEKILPILGKAKQEDRINEFFKPNGIVDKELESIIIALDGGWQISCLQLKNDVRKGLWAYAHEKGAKFRRAYSGKISIYNADYSETMHRNMIASSALVNHYLSKTEDMIGNQEGAKIEGGLSSFLIAWNRFWTWDGFLNLIGQEKQVGAVLTAERASQFSEYLQRAPHIKGLVKLFLIAIFPWLVFFVVAGRWKILVSWFAIYVSVLLWSPVWNLLYHLMTSIALSTELMAEFGRISDGVSLYSSSFITTKLYQFYAIYSWLQLFVGPLPTVILSYGLFSSFLRDNQGEQAPDVVNAVKNVGIGAATGGVSGAAKALVRKI